MSAPDEVSRRRALRCLLIAGALIVAACSSREPLDAPGRTSQPIVGGALDTTTRSVVVTGDPAIGCTGFIVSEDIVLTAAHCTAKAPGGRTCASTKYPSMYGPEDVVVFVADDMNDPKAAALAVGR